MERVRPPRRDRWSRRRARRRGPAADDPAAPPRRVGRAGGSAEDDRAVHTLRVATRRCRAALDAFEEFLGGRRRGWFARRLKRLRRAAGEARDIDVLVERLGGAAARGRLPAGRRAALERLAEERRAARRPLRRLSRCLDADDWERRVAALVARIRGRRSREPFAAFAPRGLARALAHFREAAREAAPGRGAAPPEADAIHALRIRAKKTRYALEILGGAGPAADRRRRGWFERFQDTAGAFVDHVRAAERLRRLERSAAAALTRRACARLARAEEAAAARHSPRVLATLRAAARSRGGARPATRRAAAVSRRRRRG
ncbi:MAG: CHAD domain-containing protein [Planctomycetaceae bacterium]